MIGKAISCEWECSKLDRAGGFAVVLENQNVLEAAVFLQIKNAIAKSPQHVFNSLGRKRGESGGVVGSLDDHFVRTDAIHLVEHAVSLAIEGALDAKAGNLLGTTRTVQPGESRCGGGPPLVLGR